MVPNPIESRVLAEVVRRSFREGSLDDQATEAGGFRSGTRTRNWWSTWWPFALAWPATPLVFVLATWADHAPLDSRIPVVILFPFAAALSTTDLTRSVVVALAAISQFPVYALIVQAGARREHSRTVATAVVVLHLAGVPLGSPLFWGPSLPAFGRTLAETAGPQARDCGIVPLSQDRTAAINCTRAALAEGRPFFVAFQVMGIDSTIYDGLAHRALGQTTRILWDSDVTGGSNLVPLRRIHQASCRAPVIRDAERGPLISCGEHRDPRES